MEGSWGPWPPPPSLFHRAGRTGWTLPGWGTGGSSALPRASGAMGSGTIGGAGFSPCQSSAGLAEVCSPRVVGELLPQQQEAAGRGGWA